MWKLLFQSVRGSAHERNGQPCQDSCYVRMRPSGQGPVLVLACADGAGSAGQADVGARLACRAITCLVLEELRDGLAPERIDKDTAVSWYTRLRRQLEAEASLRGIALNDFACTLLVAVV